MKTSTIKITGLDAALLGMATVMGSIVGGAVGSESHWAIGLAIGVTVAVMTFVGGGLYVVSRMRK
jgi:hypothetical protein